MNIRKISVAALALAALGGLYASSAGATPPVPAPPVASDSVVGDLDDTRRGDLEIEQDDVELEVEDPTRVQIFDVTYEVGQSSGWHSHPGIVLAVVKSGSVVRLDEDCKAETFGVGDAFYEVGPHHVSNASSDPATGVPAVLAITRIFPAEQALTPRIDEAEPRDCRER